MIKPVGLDDLAAYLVLPWAWRRYLQFTLIQSGDLSSTSYVDGFHEIRGGKNGGGDPWYTDGKLAVVTLEMAGPPRATD